jgi:hypothetical protein
VLSPWSAFGALAGTLGLATAAIGLPTTTSSATRKPKNWFQVAQARAMLAAAWLSEDGKRPAQALWRHLAEPQPLGFGADVGCQMGRDGDEVTPVAGLGVWRALQRLPGHEEVLKELRQTSTRFGLGERQAWTGRRCAGAGGLTGRPRSDDEPCRRARSNLGPEGRDHPMITCAG